ncbi:MULTISPECIES: prolipoprotein diacylglyceryl transferase [Halomonas]|jgi:phosphatidylglycerol:prolipoprotein diacylglycerol transferase|uniref:Phosphatidylglycerol--prolipoprotein diacylglyceryl transferase n=1 Tax=Halomonas ventosae TaxID=229007 RepID=A0A4R6GMK3_9GAMM|nr:MULTISPECIES: prolipoprotein diacylglyceryl transferase [Halomonas]ERS91280.1 prolipoprotein diacylglyceryl transferase [Halomonas sp. PBN3]MBF7053886.1 prolipoprotein diacylglyceryl transferase [Halomonas sp. KAO]QPL46161.1 prolipoprotein diacylglyceryl transferase [Halomonas sp. A40-4]TDN95770.1 prolipoprotein diacylglyceryl transferase [Halomonas ventosae]
MLQYPQIDPVAISLGPVQIHWYGLMYVVGLAAAWWLGRRRAHRLGLSHDDIGDLIFYAAVGIILGGRLGYALFYGLEQLLANPLWLFRVWDGGMSFHGGLAGVLIAALLFARKHRLAFFQLTDFIAPLVPIGLGAGRLGNFINHELPGRISDVPWAMVFPPMMGLGPEPRHPSALYEFALEGVVLFVMLWWLSRRPRQRGLISGLFLVLYGAFRFTVEFVRLPDPHLGFVAFGWLTMGQLLTLPMLIAGLALVVWSMRQPVDRGKTAAAS